MSLATAAKAGEQLSLAKPFATEFKVTISDWNMSSLTALLLDIFLKTVSIWVSLYHLSFRKLEISAKICLQDTLEGEEEEKEAALEKEKELEQDEHKQQ